MARGECSSPICTTLATLEETIKHDDTSSHRDDETNDADVADDAANNRDVVLREMKLVVLVAARAENLPRLNNFSG